MIISTTVLPYRIQERRSGCVPEGNVRHGDNGRCGARAIKHVMVEIECEQDSVLVISTVRETNQAEKRDLAALEGKRKLIAL